MRLLRRAEWGPDEALPRRGRKVSRRRRTEIFIHHTVIVDNDATGNEWETLRDVKRQMRKLQVIRPDLGRDVPYSMVAFCMRSGDLVLCEGRGIDRSGAHTRHHNQTALGIAFQGDFENGPTPRLLDSQLAELGAWLRELRRSLGFANLGNSRPRDSQVWGHRDAKWARTVCPGKTLYERLGQIRFIDEEDETAMDKPTWKLVQRALQNQTPPLYANKAIDGIPGRNTNLSLRAFEKRVGLSPRGVVGTSDDPRAGIWPATRELLFVTQARA